MKSEIMPFVWYTVNQCYWHKKHCTSILFLEYWWPDTTIYYSLFSNNKILKYFITCFAVCIIYGKNKYIRKQKLVQLLMSKTIRVKAHCINFHILTIMSFSVYSPNRKTMSLQRLYSFVTFWPSKDLFEFWRICGITNIWLDCTFY